VEGGREISPFSVMHSGSFSEFRTQGPIIRMSQVKRKAMILGFENFVK